MGGRTDADGWTFETLVPRLRVVSWLVGQIASEGALSSHPAGREIMFKSLSHVNHCSEVGALPSSFLTVTRKVPNCTKKRSIPSSYGAGWHDQKLLLIMPEALQTAARSAPPIQIPKFVGRRLAGAHFSCHCSCSRPLPAPRRWCHGKCGTPAKRTTTGCRAAHSGGGKAKIRHETVANHVLEVQRLKQDALSLATIFIHFFSFLHDWRTRTVCGSPVSRVVPRPAARSPA